jgi:3-hydroxybutyryl-CoA dehydratase
VTEKEFLEDCAVGERLVTPSRTITEADLVAFAGFTGDWHPLHTDAEWAATGPFGERIAHGMLVVSVGTALVFRLGPHAFLPKSFIAFYGMEKVRFTAPVKIGDTIHYEGEVSEIVHRDPGRGVLTWKGEIVNQRGEVCCALETRLLCGRRPKA